MRTKIDKEGMILFLVSLVYIGLCIGDSVLLFTHQIDCGNDGTCWIYGAICLCWMLLGVVFAWMARPSKWLDCEVRR